MTLSEDEEAPNISYDNLGLQPQVTQHSKELGETSKTNKILNVRGRDRGQVRDEGQKGCMS